MSVLDGELIKAENIETSEKALPCPFCGCVDIYYKKNTNIPRANVGQSYAEVVLPR